MTSQPDASAGFDRCGEPFGGVRPAGITYLVGAPRADTVADPVSATGTHGQFVAIGRLGGAAADEVEHGLADDRLAVLVPWGFDDRCAPIPWSGPWRWALPDSAEFFRGVLRPSGEWIDGRPTLDVPFAVWEGFPLSPWPHPLSAGQPMLSAQELFDVYGRLPTRTDLAARPYGSVNDLVEWRRDVGETASRYPAPILLREAFRMAELARLRSTPLPFAGTYRLEVRDSTGAALAAFHMRTGSAGSQPLDVPSSPPDIVPFAPTPTDAVAIGVALAIDASALPGDDRGAGTACRRPLGVHAELEDFAPDDAAHAWLAELASGFVAGCFAGHSVLGSLQTPHAGEGPTDIEPPGESSASADTADGPRFAGEFRHERDGRYTFRQPAVLPDGTLVTLVGERIEDGTLAPPPYVDEPHS